MSIGANDSGQNPILPKPKPKQVQKVKVKVKVEEEVVLRLERASVSERARAGLVDVGIGLGVSGALFGLLWGLGYPDWGWVAALVLGLMLLCRDLSFEVGSPGKLLLGLQVVTTGESQMSAPVAARLSRNMLLLLPPIGLPVAALVLAYHPMARRLGDGLSGTEVVRGGASK